MRILILLAVALWSRRALAEEPSVNKLGVVIFPSEHRKTKAWTWTPAAHFTLRAAVSSTTSVTIESTDAAGKPWVTARCEQLAWHEEVESQRVTDCGYSIDPKAGTDRVGVFGFTIKYTDGGVTKTLHTGRFTVTRKLYNPDRDPTRERQFHYLVDSDWRLPIAHVFTSPDDATIYAELWCKGPLPSEPAPVGTLWFGGKQVAEARLGPSFEIRADEDPASEYHRIQLRFRALYEGRPTESHDEWWHLYEHPGTYEIRLQRGGAPSRTVRFTVANGRPTDGGAAKSIGLDGAVVPAAVLGTGDGSWRRDAYKTEALYGSPITGL